MHFTLLLVFQPVVIVCVFSFFRSIRSSKTLINCPPLSLARNAGDGREVTKKALILFIIKAIGPPAWGFNIKFELYFDVSHFAVLETMDGAVSAMTINAGVAGNPSPRPYFRLGYDLLKLTTKDILLSENKKRSCANRLWWELKSTGTPDSYAFWFLLVIMIT